MLGEEPWQCGSYLNSKCSAGPEWGGAFLANFFMPNCYYNLPTIPFLDGSEVYCDFQHLEVKLRNVGQTGNVDFLLGGKGTKENFVSHKVLNTRFVLFFFSADKECRGTVNRGIIAFNAEVDKCGTVMVMNSGDENGKSKEVKLINRVVFKRKTKVGEIEEKPRKTRSAVVIKDKALPVECIIQYKKADISQSFGQQYTNYATRIWSQNVDIR